MIKPQLYLSIEDEGWNSALPNAEKSPIRLWKPYFLMSTDTMT